MHACTHARIHTHTHTHTYPDALHSLGLRRFVIPSNGVTWAVAEEKCKALGVSICPAKKVCHEKDKKREKKDMLKTGGKKSRLSKQLCKSKGAGAGGKMRKVPDGRVQRGVCKRAEEQDLLGRWLPLVEGTDRVWANIKTCEVKPSVPDEKVQGVIACCGGGKHAGLFAAVHPASVIQAAEKMVKQRKENGSSKDEDDWSRHEYIDKMRNSDPFLAHKKQVRRRAKSSMKSMREWLLTCTPLRCRGPR